MKENSIEEALKKLSTGKKIKMYELLRTFKREGIENFVTTRKKYVDVILSDYKRVLKENEHKTEKIENQKAELAILNDKQKDFNKLQNTLKSYKGQFRRQEKENEKLKNKEATARKINELLVQRYSNSISVQKVKDKISERRFELQQEYKDFEDDAILIVLQELLEGRK